MFTGTLALTAVCSASADEFASCPVSEPWKDCCACPLPPQPIVQLELPASWVWLLDWVVLALLLTGPLVAPFVSVWLALLVPLVIVPPAMFTGTLALTAFCLALACEIAYCNVAEPCQDCCA